MIPATVKEQERYCLGPRNEDVGGLRSMFEAARRWIRTWIRERRRKRTAVRLAMDAFRADHDESPRRASVIGSSGWDIIVRVVFSDGRKPPARAWYAVSPDENIRELSWELVQRMEAEWR